MRPRTIRPLILLVALLAALAHAPAYANEDAQEPVVITLADGTVLRGVIVSEDDATIVIETAELGLLTLARERIARIDRPDADDAAALGWRDDPDANSLLLVPTSETLPKGDSYYRNYLLLFNNLGYALTDDLAISAMAMFPISSDAVFISLGAKLRLVSRDEHGVGAAVSLSTWLADDYNVNTLSGIVSAGDRRRSVTAAVNFGFDEDDGEFFFLLGGDLQVGAGVKLLVEYGNSESALSDDSDFAGIMNVGFRWFWERTSFTLTAFRPVEVDGGGFIAFPLAMFSAHF